MASSIERNAPGTVRDAIISALSESHGPLTLAQIEHRVGQLIGPAPASSVRSYLQHNTPGIFIRERRGRYRLTAFENAAASQDDARLPRPVCLGKAKLYLGDCFDLISRLPDNSIHAVVTDPPYGLHEYTPGQQAKLRQGRGGVWRIPPSFDGHERSPLPRFTTLTPRQLEELRAFFKKFGRVLLPKLVPGANVVVACNPLLSYVISDALVQAGLERRGELIRLVMTMRGGDRPKHAHREFAQVSVMPRSMWEPWLLYRKNPEGRIQDCLRKWKTGGFRRPSPERPFGDVVSSAPTRSSERELAPHPSLKPQAFLRHVVRGVLPLGEGTILDPFAGAGSTLAAADFIGYESIGIEKDPHYFEMACRAVPKLAAVASRNS
jgi:site-specific DNA-methyltransferase (adenine-specific)